MDNPSLTLPPLREDIRLLEGPRLLDGSPSWIIQDQTRNSFFRISGLEFEILRRWSISIPEKIIAAVNESTTLKISQKHLEDLLDFLKINQLLLIEGAEAINSLKTLNARQKQAWWLWLIKNYLMLRIPLVKPDPFLSNTLPLVRFFFTRTFLFLLIFSVFSGLFLVSRQWESFQSTFLHFYSVEGMVLFALAVAFAKVLHELGHAYAAKSYGLKVPTLGIAFIVLWPVLFTDTREAWKLTSRKARLVIGSAGMMTELSLAAFCTLLWVFLPDGAIRSAAFMLATTTWIITLLINLNPLMRFDGYYLFSDYLGIANLQDRSFALGKWKLRKILFGIDTPPPEIFEPRLHRVLIIYAWGTWLYRFFLFLGIAVLVYYLFFKVAGIILMLVELVYFIGLPIYKELAAWYQMKQSLKWNIHSITTFAVFLGLIGLFLYPWHSAVKAPAVYKHALHSELFAPQAGQLKEYQITKGQRVNEGETLLRLSSPNLQQQLVDAEFELEQHRLENRFPQFETSNRDASVIIAQRIIETESKIQGLKEKIASLVIKAPFNGVISSVHPELEAGSWVSPAIRIAEITKPKTVMIEAFIEGSDIDRVDSNTLARFYPEDIDQKVIPLVIQTIEKSNTRVLTSPYLASTHGGEIAVLNKDLELQGTRFRVLLKPSDLQDAVSVKQRGMVVFDGEKQSLAERLWSQVLSVLLRESGF